MAVQRFGSGHTDQKLQTVEKYLRAFTTALKKQSFELLYVDVCAGSGASTPRGGSSQSALIEIDEIVVGSAIRALGVAPLFDRYIFNDLKRQNVRSLNQIVRNDFSHLADRVILTNVDANDALVDLCRRTNWRSSRAVVFLDPFGLQIKFSTLEALAATKAVDVWYLVPVFAMSRQVRNDGAVLDDGGRSVDEALGTTEWRNVVSVVEDQPEDLFGFIGQTPKKVADSAWFEQIAKQRLGSIFKGGVLDRTLPLGRNGLHEFSLMFAWANPGEKARLAAKLADAVLK